VTPAPSDQQIHDALEPEPRILLIDEAQGLETKALDYLHTLLS
jgi:DNA transposition AAA+ family ATPase